MRPICPLAVLRSAEWFSLLLLLAVIVLPLPAFAADPGADAEAEPAAADPPDASSVGNDGKLLGADVSSSTTLPTLTKPDVTKQTYDVSALLISPLGTIADYGAPLGRQRVPPQPLNQAPQGQFVGTQTALGILVDWILMEERRLGGTNQIAPKAGALEVTASNAGHAHAKRFFEALALMPAMNPQNNGRGLGPDRCVSLFTASVGDGADKLDYVLYDVSDFYEKISPQEIEAAVKAIDRETWADATGGSGWVLFYEPARAYVIIAKSDTQEKIRTLFADQRGVKLNNTPPPRAKRVKPPAKKPAEAKGDNK